ncbi:hypothetical protein AB205_0121630, partial [Aquarana catesbeiana]
EHACFFARRNCIQTNGISIKNFFRRQNRTSSQSFADENSDTKSWMEHTHGRNIRPKAHITLFLTEIPLVCTGHKCCLHTIGLANGITSVGISDGKI